MIQVAADNVNHGSYDSPLFGRQRFGVRICGLSGFWSVRGLG